MIAFFFLHTRKRLLTPITVLILGRRIISLRYMCMFVSKYVIFTITSLGVYNVSLCMCVSKYFMLASRVSLHVSLLLRLCVSKYIMFANTSNYVRVNVC